MAAEVPRIRTVIVDDEAPARGLLREFLGTEADVEIIAECANGFEALKAIGDHTPDLVLLLFLPPLAFEAAQIDRRNPPLAALVSRAYASASTAVAPAATSWR